MKNFKKIAFGLMVGALAIGFSAYTAPKSSNAKFIDQWFQLKSGVSPTLANALNSNNYEPAQDEQPCDEGSVYCGVQASNVSGKPDLSGSTQANTQINDYFNNAVQGARISAQE